MLIIEERQLNRLERLAIIMKQIEELETHGFGELKIVFHKGQITDSNIQKSVRFGNCIENIYL